MSKIVADKFLRRKYNMETYIPNDVNRKGTLIFCSTDK